VAEAVGVPEGGFSGRPEGKAALRHAPAGGGEEGGDGRGWGERAGALGGRMWESPWGGAAAAGEAADIVLMGNSLTQAVDAIRLSRATLGRFNRT